MSRYLIAILGNLFPPAVAIATAPVLAQALGVDGRGEVAAATAPLLLALAVSTFGVTDASVNAIAKNRFATAWVVRHAAVLLLVAGSVATVVVLLLRGPLSAGNDRILQNTVLAAAAIVPNLLISLLRSAAMGLHRWWDVTISRSMDSMMRLLAFIVLALSGQLTVMTATVVIAFAPVVGGLNLLRVAVRPPHPVERNPVVAQYRELLRFGARVWIGAASGVLLSRIDQLLMVPLAGPHALGLYAVAVSISEVPLIANSAVREVIFASESAESDDRAVGLASRLSTLVTFVIAAAIAGTMQWWLAPLFGAGFADSLPVALVLLLAVVAGNPGSVAGAALSARGHPGLRSVSLIVASIVNLILIVILVPVYGAMGAAIATLVGNLVASNGNIFFLAQRFGVPIRAFYGLRFSDLGVLVSAVRRLLKRGSTD